MSCEMEGTGTPAADRTKLLRWGCLQVAEDLQALEQNISKVPLKREEENM